MLVTIFIRDAFSNIYFMMKFYKILPKPEVLEQQRLNNKPFLWVLDMKLLKFVYTPLRSFFGKY